MIISITGTPGSGKSTVARKIAKKLGWKRYNIGSLFRKKAKQKGLTVKQYRKIGEIDTSVDKAVDEFQKKLGEKYDNFVIEGRISWYFIPHSLKIFIYVKEREGAKRIFKEIKGGRHRNEDITKIKTLSDVIKSQRERKLSELKSYKKYYGINILDLKNYDYVIDTTNLNKKQVFDKVYSYIKKRLKQIDKT